MVKARETEEMPCTKPGDVLWWAQEKSEKEKSEEMPCTKPGDVLWWAQEKSEKEKSEVI